LTTLTALRPWKTLSRTTILDHSKFLRVESHRIELPDGDIIEDWPWVISPDAVMVLAMTKDEEFILFRQTKYAVEGTSLAPVGGMLEPSEDPLEAGKRELREETGYEATEWVKLGSFALGPNQGVETNYLYLAKNAYFVGTTESDDLEDQQLLVMNKDEISKALFDGEFKVLSWATTVSLALQHLNS